MKNLGQATRLYILFFYVAILLVISYIALGSIIPPTSEKGLWFYTCLASILLGNLIISPYFNKPADAISNSVAAIIALLSFNAFLLNLQSFNRFLWLGATIFSIFIILVSIFHIIIKNFQSVGWQKISRLFYVLSSSLGTPTLVYSAVLFFALVSFHIQSPREYISISFAWLILIAVHPLEGLVNIYFQIKQIWLRLTKGVIGEVVGYQFPHIVSIKLLPDSGIKFGSLVQITDDHGDRTLAFVLDQIGFTNALWHRALCINWGGIYKYYEKSGIGAISSVLPLDINLIENPDLCIEIDKTKNSIIGLVSADSDIVKINFELVRTDLGIEEGRLVEVIIGDTQVLYQIMNGLTKEEIVEQKHSRGYVKASARKLGKWNGANFEPSKWIPQPNSPVYLVDITEPEIAKESIGYVPFTNYSIHININDLVTHNSAILGMLGVGKTYLALEIIERMISTNIKVICIDLTSQYKDKLADFYNLDQEDTNISTLKIIGTRGKNHVCQNVEEGGSINAFKEELTSQLQLFFQDGNQEMLKIYNPGEFEIWRQDSKQYNNNASMATLTYCEVTRAITEVTLNILQQQGTVDNAKCCLVFEEAHSLIPEWNSVANEGDKTATNGTAKAILQGRKYGLGCMVITQRTANVTKSILNQCHTVFALRIFDATGADFLKTYIGEDYSGILSTLSDRHAVIFGKASSCKTPILARLNDRDQFINTFRN